MLLSFFCQNICFAEILVSNNFCNDTPYQNRIKKNISTYGKPRGTAIVIHGLNQAPETMADISQVLNKIGYITLRVSLIGHSGESIHGGSTKKWLEQIRTAWCLANQENLESIVLLGFSMGGSLAVHFTDTYPTLKIDKLILLAPAIEIKYFANLLYPLLWLKHFDLSLPAFTPKKYRANNFTSFDTYSALLDLEDKTQNINHIQILSKIPTLLAIDPKDSLVSFSQLKAWVEKKDLVSWNLIEINAQAKISGLKHHVIIDEDSLGVESWNHLKLNLESFLDKKH
ncbi:MAG: alpha/beta hydrolase [Bdellovibrionales bacterium]|nr:alpha/beta hydrolase [Bdellovibrionales bacterium]